MISCRRLLHGRAEGLRNWLSYHCVLCIGQLLVRPVAMVGVLCRIGRHDDLVMGADGRGTFCVHCVMVHGACHTLRCRWLPLSRSLILTNLHQAIVGNRCRLRLLFEAIVESRTIYAISCDSNASLRFGHTIGDNLALGVCLHVDLERARMVLCQRIGLLVADRVAWAGHKHLL